jgi:hypothetical protein
MPHLVEKFIKRPFPFVKEFSRPFGNHSIPAKDWRYNLERSWVFRSPEKMETNSIGADQSPFNRKADAIEYVFAVGLNNKLSTNSCLASWVQVCFGILHQH